MKPQLAHISPPDCQLKPIKVTEELSAVAFAFTMFNHQQPGSNPIVEANSSNRIYQTLWNEHPASQPFSLQGVRSQVKKSVKKSATPK